MILNETASDINNQNNILLTIRMDFNSDTDQEAI